MTRKATERAVSRRGFIKGSTLATLATAAGAGTAASLFGCAPQSAQSKGELAQTGSNGVVANEIPEEGEVIWQSCCHCGFVACPLKCHVVDGTLRWIDNDTDGDRRSSAVMSFRLVPQGSFGAKMDQQPRSPQIPHETRGQTRKWGV